MTAERSFFRLRVVRVWTVLAATALLLPTACTRADDAGGDARPTVTSVEYQRPGDPVEIGTGFLVETSLDGSAAYVEEPDPRFPKPGCEGEPEPVMFRLPLSGGTRELLGTGKEPLNGRIARGKGRRVAVVSACEEFFSRLLVGGETVDGHLTHLEEVTLQRREDEPSPSPNTFAWSLDGRHLLAAVNEATGSERGPVPLLQIDPSTGVSSRVFDVSDDAGISQVDQLADGAYVLAGDEVTLRDGTGAVTATFEGNGFALSPDRRHIAVFGRTLALVTPGGPEPVTLVPSEPDRQITAAAFSPDGRAIAYISRASNNDTLSISTPANSTVTKVAGPGSLGQPAFSGDGKHLAYNEFGGDALNFVAKVVLVSFRT